MTRFPETCQNICSDEISFNKAAEDIMVDFVRIGYKKIELETEYNQAPLIDREDRLKPKKTEHKEPKSCKLILSAQYCKDLRQLRKFINTKMQSIEPVLDRERFFDRDRERERER